MVKRGNLLVTAVGLALILIGVLLVASVVVSASPLSLLDNLSDVKVVDLNGNPVVGASVSLVAYSGAPELNGVTNSYGIFSFDPDVIASDPSLVMVSFNGYSAQSLWHRETWSTLLTVTLNFHSSTPTPTPYNPTPTPTTNPYPIPTPTLHPSVTPFPTPSPNPIIPIPNNPVDFTCYSRRCNDWRWYILYLAKKNLLAFFS